MADIKIYKRLRNVFKFPAFEIHHPWTQNESRKSDVEHVRISSYYCLKRNSVNSNWSFLIAWVYDLCKDIDFPLRNREIYVLCASEMAWWLYDQLFSTIVFNPFEWRNKIFCIVQNVLNLFFTPIIQVINDFKTENLILINLGFNLVCQKWRVSKRKLSDGEKGCKNPHHSQIHFSQLCLPFVRLK